ncbi:MAG: CinA family nicotinamide mononucleotide deamidase-related protein [Desulfohalobiaceae bacterium]|nr:CinA family nicotinamide mononucleotide deamidase-related protein [Desulfohalobiaceae bacterium]
MLRLEIAATGKEILSGRIADSNSAWLAEQLRLAGAEASRLHAVGDEVPALTELLREIASRADLAIVTGGLGSTPDDITARAAAECSGRPLVRDPEALQSVKDFWGSRMGTRMPEEAENQALIPEDSLVLQNPMGSAPGFGLSISGCRIYFLPGVPREMKRMFTDFVLPQTRSRFAEELHPIQTSRMNVFGLSESGVSRRLDDFHLHHPRIELGYRTLFPRIQLCLYAYQTDTSEEEMAQAKQLILERLGANVVSAVDESMPEVIGRLLRERDATLSLAESCTGGLISRRITSVAGSSDYFSLSAVTYSNLAKTSLLGVRESTLENCGAVHEETAQEMAEGMRRLSGSTYALSTTGVAGPGGGTAEKPVGTVCLGLAWPKGSTTRHIQWDSGDRLTNQSFFAECALDLLRRRLSG